MARSRGDVVIGVIILSSVAVVYLLTFLLRFSFDDTFAAVPGTKQVFPNEIKDNWIFRLCLNCLGYATVFIPGYLIFQYVKRSTYIEKSGSGYFTNLIRQCFVASETPDRPQELLSSSSSSQNQRSLLHDTLLLAFCFLGLQASYLTWGILQEKIMTKEYEDTHGVKGYFKDSQFLVFVNRILAFILAGFYTLLTRQSRHTAPLYKYSYCSFSNILSSWCQYEALKFVSFPTQVLAKASKIIPVMIMGKVVSRAKYEYYEYLTAVLISVGMALFLWGAGPSGAKGTRSDGASSFSGVFLLVMYLIADSFTSNWQGALFKQHHLTSMQMMCGVNLFSCLFTTVSLLQQGGFGPSFAFMTTYYQFMLDCLVLSICSAAGQLFIFFTISKYGAVVFAIIMTVRQGLAILLSCLIYHHELTVVGGIGVIIVFVAVFLRMYCSHRLKNIHRRRTLTPLPSKV